MKNLFKVGDRVKSHFRARWEGEIIDIEILRKTTSNKRDKKRSIATVLVDTDQYGKPLRKKETHKLHTDWLTKI